MSRLSIGQRERALGQLDRHIELLTSDAGELERRLADVRGLITLQKAARASVEAGLEGRLSAEQLMQVDEVCGSRLAYGLVHYPVRVVSGEKVLITGRWS